MAIALKNKRAKKKVNNNNEYYNYHKFGFFERDCVLLNRRLNKMIQQFRMEKSWKKNLCKSRKKQSNISNKANQIAKNRHNNNSNLKPFIFSFIKNNFIVKK